MQRQRMLSLAIGLLLATVPVASATWYGHGTYEPDTLYDQVGGWMQIDPDTNPDQTVRKVYFNAYPNEYVVSVNANVAALGSRVLTTPTLHFFAYFGVWKDCNGDGYVGLAEGAAREYRAELVDVTGVCPVDAEDPLAHNDGEWVIEYVPIGYNASEEASRSFIRSGSVPAEGGDFGSWVWADRGIPGARPGTSCPIAPLPHGTTANTGLAIRYVDCFIGKRIATTVNQVDSTGGLGLRFDDENNPQNGNSLLNQNLPESIFGNPVTKETGTLQKDTENDGEAAFTTWDCSERSQQVRDPTAKEGERGQLSNWTIRDPTGDGLAAAFGEDGELNVTLADESGAYAWLATPAFSPADPRWSVAAGLNQTADGTHVFVVDDELGDEECGEEGSNWYSEVHETAFFYPDGEHSSTAQTAGKVQNEFNFNFFDGTTESYDPRIGKRAPNTLGLAAAEFTLGTGWRAGTVYVSAPQSMNRNTLSPDPALYWTFYARVDPSVVTAHKLLLPNGDAVGTYGTDNCPVIGPGAPDANGWVCDPEKWYINPTTGEDVKPPTAQRVGAPYQLRDVDCFDGTIVRGVEVYASLAWLSEGGVCKDAVPQ